MENNLNKILEDYNNHLRYRIRKRDKYIEYVCRNIANPPLKGIITPKKMKELGIQLYHSIDNKGGIKHWIEQNGVMIGDYF